MHVVVTRFSSLGDVVIHTGFINALRSQYPNIKISFLTLQAFSGLLDKHPAIDKVYGYKKREGIKDIQGLKSIFREIEKDRTIDFIIDLHGTTRSFLFKFLHPSIPCLNLDKRRFERFLAITLKLKFLYKAMGLQKRVVGDLAGLLDLSLSDAKTSLQSQLSKPLSTNQDDQYIVVAPIASFSPKRWPIENFNALLELLLADKRFDGLNIKIVAGPTDDYVDGIMTHKRVENLKGKTSLFESSKIIAGAKFVLGNDTGMGHIAEAHNIPSFVLFGPTHPILGFAPYLKNSKALMTNEWCSPCSGTGKKSCFRKQQYCFSKLDPKYVLEELVQVVI